MRLGLAFAVENSSGAYQEVDAKHTANTSPPFPATKALFLERLSVLGNVSIR